MEKLIREVADHYGFDSQSRQLIEEMAELTSAVNHFWRKDLQCGAVEFNPKNLSTKGVMYGHLLEEMADVAVCLEQLIYLTNSEDEILYLMKLKLHRQMERIKRSDVNGLSM